MPRSAPTSTGSIPFPASCKAWARASAGMRCPPVPPPAKRTFTTPPKCGVRNAECGMAARVSFRDSTLPLYSAFRIPHSALLRSPTPAHAHQHSRCDQGDEQARPPVRDERQRDARGREERERYADVQHRGDPDHPRKSHREQPAERIAGRLRDAEAEPRERAEQHDECEHAEKAPLLADRRENEVGIGVGQVAELLRSEEHTSELQSPCNLVCRLLLEKK